MFYLFKIERCDAINLLSKHETFDGRFFVAHLCELHRLVGMGGVPF